MITNTLLYAVESYGNIGGTVWGVDLAAKTGTTNLDSETIAYYGYPSYAVNDMWDVGYTPEVTVSLWYGYDKLLPGYYNVNGVEKNILYVAFGEDPEELYSDECIIENVNLINPTDIKECTAKFRYRGKDYPVSLEYLDDGNIRVSYPCKVKSVTPGQACVLYDGEECLGSGIIKEVRKNNEKLWYKRLRMLLFKIFEPRRKFSRGLCKKK